jgi:radical SAM protein with 4Fe4S-binding SPASM domain
MLAIILGIAIIALAAFILTRRAIQFHKTKGQSACANCPYSGRCSGSCQK